MVGPFVSVLCLHCSNGTGLPTGMEAAQTSFFFRGSSVQHWFFAVVAERRVSQFYLPDHFTGGSGSYVLFFNIHDCFSWMAPNAGVAGWNRTRRSWNHFFGIVHQLLLCYGESCAFQYCGQEIEGTNLPSLWIWFAGGSRCHILCINNCVSSNFLWHTLWSFLGIRHFPLDVKQMCLLWFRFGFRTSRAGIRGATEVSISWTDRQWFGGLWFFKFSLQIYRWFFFAETWSSYPNGFTRWRFGEKPAYFLHEI